MKLKAVRATHHKRISLQANGIQQYTPVLPRCTAMIIYSHVAGVLSVSPYSDVDRNPMFTTPNGGAVMWARPEGIDSINLVASVDGLVDIMEYDADEVGLDIQTSTVSGSVNVANWPAAWTVTPGTNPWPVDVAAGQAPMPKVMTRQAMAAGGTQNVWVPTAGRKIHLRGVSLTASGPTVLTIKLGGTTILERDFAGAGAQDPYIPDPGVLGPQDGVLTVTSSATVTVGVTAYGREE